jgi:hypothetical protein
MRVSRCGTDELTYAQLRSQRFTAPARGVRIGSEIPSDPPLEMRIALAASKPGRVVCDVSAARLWGLPLPTYLRRGETRIGIAVPAGNAEPRHQITRGRRLRLPEEHITEHDGCLVTTPERTWIDCAAKVREDELLAMADAGIHMGLFTEDELKKITHWAYRRRGVAHARRVVPMINGLAESPGESKVRFHLVMSGFFDPPECQINLHDCGEFIARVDLGWRQRTLAVEYDGVVHLAEDQRRRDAWRRNRIEQMGWRVIVVTADDLREPHRMVDIIKDAYESRTPLR